MRHLDAPAIGVRRVGHELLGHLRRRQLVVHHTGGNGAAWHAVVFGGFGRLRHHHAAFALDGAHTQRAVTAGAREHDADGALPLVLCQRGKEKVDGQALATRRHRVKQLQRATQKSHVAVRRDDVGAVDSHRHAVFHLKHLHAGVALDQLDQHAFVVGRQVLHQHKGHAGFYIGRHAGEKGFKGGKTAGRGAKTHDREARLADGGLAWRNRRGVRRACRCGALGGRALGWDVLAHAT